MIKKMLLRIRNVVLLLILLLVMNLGVSNAVEAAPITKLVFTTAPQTIVAGIVSTVMTIQSRDATDKSSNTLLDTTVNLASSSTSGKFYSDSAGSNQITTVTITGGTSLGRFYYKDTASGAPTITATESPSSGWTAASQDEIVEPAALDHFSFAAIGNQKAGVAFSVSITAMDAYGNTVTSYTGTNTLSDTTGTISPTTTGAFTGGIWTGNVTITPAQNGVTISTSDGSKSGSSNIFDITLASSISKLVFTTTPQTIVAGEVSGVITLQTQDTNNNPYGVIGATTINLVSSSASGTFYGDAAGLSQITAVTINAGENSANFYYKDTTAGSPTITAVESPSQGWIAATEIETVNAAALDHFAFNTISNQRAGTAFSISITALDIYGNTVTSYTGINTLSVGTGTISPTTTGAFTGGIWTGNVTISSVQNGVTITISNGDKSGVSNAFDVVVNGTASKLVFTSGPQTIVADQVSGVITVQSQDADSNPYNVTENTTINLTSSSTSGRFYSDAAGSNQITTITIVAGTNSANFYYKDTASGSPTITGRESPLQGWTAATQSETINLATTTASTGSKGGFSLVLVLIISAGGVVFGLLIGYYVLSRLKQQRNAASTQKTDKKTREPKKKPEPKVPQKPVEVTEETKQEVMEKTAKTIDELKQEPLPEVMQDTVEAVNEPKQRPVPEMKQETTEVTQETNQEPEPEVMEETAKTIDEPKQEPQQAPEIVQNTTEAISESEPALTSGLLKEIEANLHIANTHVEGSLVAFQTKVWESTNNEVGFLPVSIKEELNKVYYSISLANGIVWLATNQGRRSANLDNNYANLCKNIISQINTVIQSWPAK